jgi:hypothetical protein
MHIWTRQSLKFLLALLVLAALPARAQTSPCSDPLRTSNAAGNAAGNAASDAAKNAAPEWAEVGRQGITRFVIVPLAQARDRQAYAQQIDTLCRPNESCFLNFFTNSGGVALTMPLPDAVLQEPTVIFRRSSKQGAELFRWSCRLALPDGNCF